MEEKKSFYLTTTLPYVNAEAHMGHAMEFIRADIIARYKERMGFDVFFNTGTDEHGQKVFTAAIGAGLVAQEYVDSLALKFRELLPRLGVTEKIHFIRTTDEKHIEAAQELWRRVENNGYIYKKNYKTKYCVGCEAEKTDSEIENGRCAIHTNLELEVREEENYFFKYSAFKEKLRAFYAENPTFVVPDSRFNEMKEFVTHLEDFSISRLKSKMAWGISVPGDEEHVMYVWFDALTSYISTLGWPKDEARFNRYWREGTPTQYCGKDNTRFQAAMWQAMLMAADLPNSARIVVNGFVTGEGGLKMSKSLGNVINPLEVIDEYGSEALRYFVSRELSTFEDSEFTRERIREAYNSSLANGIGNLVSRVMKMAESNLEGPVDTTAIVPDEFTPRYEKALDEFNIKQATDVIWEMIATLDRKIQEKEPFKLVKVDKAAGQALIKELALELVVIAMMLKPIMPVTADKIGRAVLANKLEEPLFMRKDVPSKKE
jgi:methionyl-tRNA synthetase